MTRRVVLVVVLLCGIAHADRTRRIVRSYATCDMGVCNEAQKKLYEEEPTLELVTMGIGSLAWERHGHIAMCVRWHDAIKDICFNYGIGSFDKPLSMAWGFFRGTTSFWAGEQTIESLIQIYAGRNRTVWVQPLPLSASEKEEVLDALYRDTAPMKGREMMRPEKWRGSQNLHYAYDHFTDNCTTRVRDILDQATKKKLSKFAATQDTDGKTLRELARDGFYGMKLFLLITDVAMGRITDHVPDYWERMFLPQFLREAAFKVWPEIPPIIIYQRDPSLEKPELSSAAGLHDDADGNGLMDAEEDRDHASGRIILAFLLILLTAPAVLTRYFGKLPRLGMTVAVLPQFLVGGILWFLAIISPLPYVMWNESLLILLPIDIVLLFLSPVRRKQYAQGRVGMLVLVGLLMLIGVFKQPILELILWPLIPNFIVGFWKPQWSRRFVAEAKKDGKSSAKNDEKAETKTEDNKAKTEAGKKTEDKKADKKAEDKKTESKKTETDKKTESKAEDKKADKKAEDKKTEDKKTESNETDKKAESTADDKKTESKAEDKKTESKETDKKAESKLEDKKTESKAEDKKAEDKKTESKKAESKIEDPKAESKPDKAAESK